jgi:hypothetical protein
MMSVSGGYEAADFDRAVAVVSAEPSPRRLVELLGVDWHYLGWLALDAAATVLGEHDERRGQVVSYGGEAFTAGFLIGMHLPPQPPRLADGLGAAVDAVQVRGRHAVIADHCDLASVAHLETVYSGALVESMPLDAGDQDVLRPQVTRIFEAGLAVGLELGSGGEDGGEPPQ